MTWTQSFVALDTETTGLTSVARVLEIGLVYFENGQPVDRWSTLLDPPDLDWNHPAVKEALAINRLAREDCRGKPRFEDVAGELFERLSESAWVAHNAEFDLRMLQQECTRAGIGSLPRPELQLCTKLLSYKIHPSEKSHTLESVARRWGVSQPDAHRAVVDAETCGSVLQKMIDAHRLPESAVEMVSFSKEASAAWSRRPKGRW